MFFPCLFITILFLYQLWLCWYPLRLCVGHETKLTMCLSFRHIYLSSEVKRLKCFELPIPSHDLLALVVNFLEARLHCAKSCIKN